MIIGPATALVLIGTSVQADAASDMADCQNGLQCGDFAGALGVR